MVVVIHTWHGWVPQKQDKENAEEKLEDKTDDESIDKNVYNLPDCNIDKCIPHSSVSVVCTMPDG